ncbi:MAG: outer membrane lipoprotein carrier protein LolA [Proteobacteria bacterium]|nr:outer membrane lipoprotein carrier protein LolA [Pseudomonadota bacterium]
MKLFYIRIGLIGLLIWFLCHPAFCEDITKTPIEKSDATLDHVLEKIEKKYAGAGFGVDFEQESTLKAMQITDTASGKAFFDHPDKMRWEYEKPDRQLIISNGMSLWIYKPNDNQVMIGKSPDFFKNGKGASFLTDIESIRTKFSVKINQIMPDKSYELKLVPLETNLDLAYIFLVVSGDTYDIREIKTCNSYGDETRIMFKNMTFQNNLAQSMFTFTIPPGADVLSLDEE